MRLSTKLAAGLLAAGVTLTGVVYAAPQVMAANGQGAPASEQAAETETQDDAAVLATATVTAEQAKAAALAAYPGATASNATLEDEDGTATYGVQVTANGKRLDVKVNALTGKVVRADSDAEGND